jgi:uncharacterized protein YyaL (SSP411 family)
MSDSAPFHFSPRPNRAHEIQWRSWGDEAFWAARHQGKPLLLSISAVWCHWCHTMDETTYSDPEIIATINERFIPVRIDADQRPDINLRYNLGGWPTTAFLTPAGEVITGGTFIPPDAMREAMKQVLQYWAENREKIQDVRMKPEGLDPATTPAEPRPEALQTLVTAIQQQFDRAYGGIGQVPKFPHYDVWEACFAFLVGAGEGWAAGMAVRTMDAMAGSNLMDQWAGGFFRYSTTREWTIPHFEKLLEDNARMVLLYLHGFQVMGDLAYREVAQKTLSWMDQTLLLPTGLFGGSQDADEQYYRTPPDERAKLKAPAVDPTPYAGPNAVAVRAHLLASVLISPHYRAMGLTALEALYIQLWEPEVGLFHDPSRAVVNWLADLSELGLACLDAYELTGDPEHLARARSVLAVMDRELTDDTPGFFDRPADPDAPGRLAVRQKPLPDNAVALRFLWRLGRLTGDEALMARAKGWLGAFAPLLERFGVFGAAWAYTYWVMEGPPLDARIVTSEDHRTDDLRQAVFAIYDLNRAIVAVDVDDPKRSEWGYPDEPLPALYLCRGTACAAPVTDPAQVAEAFRSLVVPAST